MGNLLVGSQPQGVVDTLPVGRLTSYGDPTATVGIEYGGGNGSVGVIQSPVQLTANRGTIPSAQAAPGGGSWGPNLAQVCIKLSKP